MKKGVQLSCRISIVWGIGIGDTPVSAFDRALEQAGIHKYNLIELSSVIPSYCEIIETGHWQPLETQRGDRMYVVLSKAIVPPGEKAQWAGLGWINVPERGGIFVEVQGDSYTVLTTSLKSSLREMSAYRPHLEGKAPHFRVVQVEPSASQFASGIVAAVYRVVSW